MPEKRKRVSVSIRALEKDGWKVSQKDKDAIRDAELIGRLEKPLTALEPAVKPIAPSVGEVEKAITSVGEKIVKTIEAEGEKTRAAVGKQAPPNIEVKPTIEIPDDEGAVYHCAVERDRFHNFITGLTIRKIRAEEG